jgi:hypothetical protein
MRIHADLDPKQIGLAIAIILVPPFGALLYSKSFPVTPDLLLNELL